MLNEPTLTRLKEMKLFSMAEAWSEQSNSSDMKQCSFDERFGLLVDAEFLSRENRRLARLLREAKLRISDACIEDVDTPARRGLDKAELRRLATCEWVQQHRNVIITGATGVGKTYLACALAQNACRKGHRVLYRRMSRLLDELKLARADGTYPRLLAKLSRFDVIVLDDWGLPQLNDTAKHDILEVLEDRYDMRSTIITSQLPIAHWHEYIADPSLADALLDRVVHNAYKVELKGPSRKKEKAQAKS
ncbi:MAG: IS21-like element helper ATPase IstB [Myxococcota bacterium]